MSTDDNKIGEVFSINSDAVVVIKHLDDFLKLLRGGQNLHVTKIYRADSIVTVLSENPLVKPFTGGVFVWMSK